MSKLISVHYKKGLHLSFGAFTDAAAAQREHEVLG